MGSAYAYDTKAGKRWEARYRKPDGKTARKGGFLRKRDAEAYIAEVEVSKSAGTYIAPSDAHATIAALGVDWLVAHEAAVKPSTYHSDGARGGSTSSRDGEPDESVRFGTLRSPHGSPSSPRPSRRRR